MIKDLKIGLDIDDVLADFWGEYKKLFGTPGTNLEISKNVMKLRNNKSFWVNLPVREVPSFPVELYCTARVNKKEWTKEFLAKNNMPKAPVYQVYGHGLSKVPRIKGRIDVFVDDSTFNFKDLICNGIPCLLMDSWKNQDFDTPARVFSLDPEELYNVYKKVYL